jgi:hypothetical protein
MAEEVKSDSEKKKEDWMNSKWRPMMGWMYMCVCTFDFMIAPILWSIVQTVGHGSVQTQWQPLTLQGAGLFHVAMGAVLGIAAYGRTQEKLNGANNGGLAMPSTSTSTFPTTSSVSTPVPTPTISTPVAAAPMPVMARPMPSASVAPTPINSVTPSAPIALDPSDPPLRNTRNDL